MGTTPTKPSWSLSNKHSARLVSLKTLHDTVNGIKPFSVVDKKKDPWLFKQVMAHAEVLDVRMHYPDELAYTARRLDHKKYHVKYLALHRSRNLNEMSREYFQRQMGKLFGYSEESTQEFIDSGLYCECRNCGGTELK